MMGSNLSKKPLRLLLFPHCRPRRESTLRRCGIYDEDIVLTKVRVLDEVTENPALQAFYHARRKLRLANLRSVVESA